MLQNDFTPSEAAKELQRVHGDEGLILVDIWTADDFYHVGEEMEVELTDEEIRFAMYLVEQQKDANIGINWDTIEAAVRDSLKEFRGESR